MPSDKGNPVFHRGRYRVENSRTFRETEVKASTVFQGKLDSFFVNPESFGAKGDGVHDDWKAIQDAVDFVVANQARIKTVVFKSSRYKSSKPIMVYSWNGNNYNQVTIDLIGQSSFWQGSQGGTVLDFSSNKLNFGIGIQLGKGCRIKGLTLVGGFQSPQLTGYDFFSCSFERLRRIHRDRV
jgi:hypothetical protein